MSDHFLVYLNMSTPQDKEYRKEHLEFLIQKNTHPNERRIKSLTKKTIERSNRQRLAMQHPSPAQLQAQRNWADAMKQASSRGGTYAEKLRLTKQILAGKKSGTMLPASMPEGWFQ